MKNLLLILALLIPGAAEASGVFTLTGKLTSLTEQRYIVETKNSIFTVKREAVSKADQARITRTEVPVSMTIPFEAVESVKPLSKSLRKT